MLFINHLLGIPLHPGQIEYIDDTKRYPVGHAKAGTEPKVCVLVPSNRWGKTTVAACLQIHANFYKMGIPMGNRDAWLKAGYRTANVAPLSPLVEPCFNYIDQILTSSFPIRLPDGRIISNKCQIEWFYLKQLTQKSPPMKQFFANNSYIEHRTIGMTGADSLEGKPYGLITYDEGGRSNRLQAEVDGTILARLFDWGGQFHLLSTPDQGSSSILYHYELYNRGLSKLPGYYTLEGQLKDNIFFPPDQIEAQYRLYEDNPLRDQVIYGKFVFGGDQLYSIEDIRTAQTEALNDGERRQEGHAYVVGTDTAIGADEMVHTVLDTTDFHVKKDGDIMLLSGELRLVKQTAHKGNSKSPQRHLNDFIDLYDNYRGDDQLPYILETWNGESVRYYHDLPEYIRTNTQCYGTWQPNKHVPDNANRIKEAGQKAKKSDILTALSKCLSSGVLKIPAIDPNPVLTTSNEKPGADLIQQLSIYKEDDKNIPTDRLMSLALACWLAIEQNVKQDTIQFINW